jgi:predicted secreted protein
MTEESLKQPIPEETYQALMAAGNAFRHYARLFQNEGEERWRKRMDVAEEHADACFRALDLVRVA